MTTKTDELERRGFEAWWESTPILKENKRTIAEKAYQAGRAALQSQDREDAEQAEWMLDDGRAPWAINSFKARIKEMRASEKRCRNAFKKDYMRVVSVYFADALGEAAAVFEARLNAIDHARRIEGADDA